MSESTTASSSDDALPRARAPAADRVAMDSFEQSVLRTLVEGTLKERRATRRWGIFFKLCLLVYGIALVALYMPRDIGWFADTDRHVAVVRLDGVISSNSQANSGRIVGGLKAAFENDQSSAVILSINSPGGSPVQSGIIYDEMVRLRKAYPDKPLYAVLGDLCASGGYYVASAADKIYADKASLVGSIGVISKSFGFTEVMAKLGVERRVFAAGRSKSLLDPFSPLQSYEAEHMRKLLAQVHEQFIDVVKRGRGERLGDDPDLFSGLIWSGEESIRLGLVDALGNVGSVARGVVGVEKTVDYSPRIGLLDRLSRRLGMTMAHATMSEAHLLDWVLTQARGPDLQ